MVYFSYNLFSSQVTSLTIDILGPYSILQECSIKITMTRLSTATSRTNLQTIQYFIQRLASYFQVTEEEIGVVSYSTQSSSTSVVFTWSYCSATYRTQAYQTDSSTLKVDYFNLQIKILRLLFDGNRKVQTSFLSVFSSQFTIRKVETQFTGRYWLILYTYIDPRRQKGIGSILPVENDVTSLYL